MILSTLFSMVALSQFVVADASLSLPRHLEYAFTVSEQGGSEAQTGAMGTSDRSYASPENTATTSGSGMGGMMSSDGGTGTMTVDVLSVTADGALIVQISELVDATKADELMITTMVHDSADRLRSFELVADLARASRATDAVTA